MEAVKFRECLCKSYLIINKNNCDHRHKFEWNLEHVFIKLSQLSRFLFSLSKS